MVDYHEILFRLQQLWNRKDAKAAKIIF